MTEQNFVDSCVNVLGYDELLVKNTIEQFGDWEIFIERAQDVYNHGIDGGFGGFIYYADTCKFFCDNRDAILEMAEHMASDMGEDMFAMIASFNCLKSMEPKATEIAKALYTDQGELAEQIQNAMAWFTGEEIARAYVRLLEENEED